MNIAEQIRMILNLKENHEIEFKSAAGGFPKAEFWKTFSAFANTNGGTIIVGVKEKNHKFIPDGLTEEQIDKYRKEFWDDAHNKSCVNLPLLFESDIEEIETDGGQKVLVFHIPRVTYDLRPIHLTLTPFGHTYKRRHEGDYLCTDEEVKQMYSDANNMKASADSRILRGYTMEDIDKPTLQQYRRAYNRKHENHPWADATDMKFLENIGAYRKDRANSNEGFTVAGILMFGKTNSITDPECCQEFFPDYRERLSDDPQIRWTNRIYPDGTWEANIYQFFTRVLPMIQHALPVPFSLDENQQRNDMTSAHIALREALANCLIHCAYTVKGNITVDRYFDHIVMSNPGTMLVSMDEYLEGGHSVCRNPVLQKMFIFLGIGEKGGSGADVIAKGWMDNGWTIPTLVEKSAPDRVETSMLVSESAIIDSVADNIADKLSIKRKIADKLSKKREIADKFKINDNFIDNMTEIMLYLKDRPHSSTETLSTVVDKSVSRTKNYLQAMVELQCIIAEGGNRNRTYSMGQGTGDLPPTP